MKRSRSIRRRLKSSWTPSCEMLEDRCLLAVFTVTNLLDSGPGTLRDALNQANLATGGDSIEFQAGLSGTIPVTSGQLTITDDVDIDGSTGVFTLDANGAGSRVFNIDDNDPGTKLSVTIDSLTIQGASVATGIDPRVFGGGIRNTEDLTLLNSLVTGNGADNGGGIANLEAGRLTLDSTKVNANSALNRGGGIYNGSGGTLIATESNVDQNDSSDLGGGITTGSQSYVTLTDSTVEQNSSVGRGGGIYASSFGTGLTVSLTISGTSISGNNGDDGAGLMLGSAVSAVISESDLNNNHSLDRGGAVHLSGFSSANTATLELQNVNVLNNIADDDGGGVHVGTSAELTVFESNIDFNTAASRGGGVNLTGFGSAFTSVVSITGSSVSGNSTMDDGGGIHAGSAAELTVADSVVSDNYAFDRGGGLRISGFDNALYPNVTTITGSVVSGNLSNDTGAGIYNGSATNTLISTTSVVGNVSGADAGGVAVLFRGTMSIDKSTIANNTAASEGGGIDLGDANLTISESTISGNLTDVGGGSGIFIQMEPATVANYSVSIQGSTIVQNKSNYMYAGGIDLSFAELTLTNSIVSGNTRSDGVQVDLYNYYDMSTINITHTLVGHNYLSGLVESGLDANGNIIGGDIGGSVSPMLGSLADNGGPTMTHLPRVDSPVIDAGDPAVMSGTDQRELLRVAGGRTDMGSVEVQVQSEIDGDFNDDGLYDCTDVNALSAEVASGANGAAFDLDANGAVDLVDLSIWLSVAGEVNLGPGKAYLAADANLDGSVNGGDFLIWNSNKFTANSAFCSGDFNANGASMGPISSSGMQTSLPLRTLSWSPSARPRKSHIPTIGGY